MSFINIYAKKWHRKHAQRHAQRQRHCGRSTKRIIHKAFLMKRFFYVILGAISRFPLYLLDLSGFKNLTSLKGRRYNRG